MGNGVVTMVRSRLTPSMWVSFEVLTKANVGSSEGAERGRVSVLLQPLKWLVNAEILGLELKTLGG